MQIFSPLCTLVATFYLNIYLDRRVFIFSTSILNQCKYFIFSTSLNTQIITCVVYYRSTSTRLVTQKSQHRQTSYPQDNKSVDFVYYSDSEDDSECEYKVSKNEVCNWIIS